MLIVNFEALYGLVLGIDYVQDINPDGVQTVQDVRVVNKAGSIMGYSDFAYDVYGATYKHVIYPSIDPMIFELKFPNQDIKGRVVPL